MVVWQHFQLMGFGVVIVEKIAKDEIQVKVKASK